MLFPRRAADPCPVHLYNVYSTGQTKAARIYYLRKNSTMKQIGGTNVRSTISDMPGRIKTCILQHNMRISAFFSNALIMYANLGWVTSENVRQALIPNAVAAYGSGWNSLAW